MIGISALVLFASANYIYLYLQLHKVVKILLRVMIYGFILATALHWLPGFVNLLVINQVKISPLSIPFSMYVNFDQPMVILILYVMHDLYWLEKNHKQSYQQLIKYTLLPYLSSIPLVLIPAYLSGCIVFEPHMPDILCIWAINNLFLVCMAEEIIFRGLLQKALQNGLKKYSNKSALLAIIITSSLFGMAHFQGGFIYIGLATMASCLYGYSYYKTGKIVCSMMVHFALNLLHILLFTYPMAITR
ncbi:MULTISPECIES: CPBP family intramembrane glutamic endopeptidase [unclassified Candidatus Cardinium]|uniref:CPBP family intramembrane glutamic endopeptidase n=1 Tax=unclassified Candidatus Cardinium TaxID=2641185 RepID=UPI001FB3CCDE|nr:MULTISPECIES: CPBP family intramembrane glutamic endopeptidase [unclassified Candidatus Cardinium]